MWKAEWNTIFAMQTSHEYESFISDKLGNNLFINDRLRAERLNAYAMDGADGSTNAEVIEDWREFVKLHPCDPDADDEEEGNVYEARHRVIELIDACEARHQKFGTLDKVIG